MAVDIKSLKAAGVSAGAYKKIFTAKKLSPLQQKLIDTISQRVVSGREANLNDYRTYWAIDLAHEVPFQQTTPTLVQSLLSRNLKAEEVLKELEAYGLSERDLFLTVQDGQVQKKVINIPVFYQILIPLVRAYHTIRTGRIFNERDRSPLLPFHPSKQTNNDRIKCEIVTDVVDKNVQWYGYSECYLKTAIQQTLKYGVMLSFPKEEWHCEKQIIDGKEKVQKEGLRYDVPHPTRMGWDLMHPLPTINTDTGIEYAWHWSVVRAGDVLDNRMYWNRESITYGTNWMDKAQYRNYFNEVYPCQMKFPAVATGSTSREERAAMYGTAERDNALFLTEFFWKIVPAKWGLANYKYPVWHRFTVAGDGTILWAAPCAYNPVWFMGYDFDAQAGQPSSFSLECIPWQDHIGNLLSQMVLTAKQNLENTVFYDENIVTPDNIKAMENLGERRYRSRNYIPFNSLKTARAGLDVGRAFMPVENRFTSIVEMQSMLSTAISLMERVLQITAQETGAAGPHYQSKEEIVKTAGGSENRINFTSSSVDAGIDAWKLQLYQANLAYRDDGVEAQINNDIPEAEKILKELGFKTVGNGSKKILVSGSKKTLDALEFSRTNVSPKDEAVDKETATVLFQTLQIISQKPEFGQAIGVKRLLKLIEMASKLAGAPHDFDITSETEDAGGDAFGLMAKQMKPILEQLQQDTLGKVVEKFAQPAAQKMGEQEQQIAQLEATVKQLEQIYKIAAATQDKNAIEAEKAKNDIAIANAKAQAEEQRKQQAHELEMQQMQQKSAVEIATESQQAAVDLAAKAKAAEIAVTSKQNIAEVNLQAKKDQAKVSKKAASKSSSSK